MHEGEDLHRDLQAWMVVAMSQYRSQHPDEARVSLARGAEVVEKKLPKLESGNLGNDWRDWITAPALLREARALLEAETRPANPR